MRIESSVTSVSWIPSEAVTGPVLKGTFDSGLHALRRPAARRDRRPRGAARAGRSASRTISRPGPRSRVDASRTPATRAAGSWATTVRLAKLRATFEPVPLPDIRHEPEIADGGPLRADHRRAHRPPRAAPGEAPAVRAVPRADGVDDARAHHPGRRHVVVRGARRQQVPAPLGLRRRRQARGQGRPRRLQGLVPRRVREAHAVGRPRFEGAR